jgi:uncharacterized protein YbjT (DUF2867 family)
MIPQWGNMIPQTSLPARIHLIGASGRSGAALTRALLARGVEVVPVVRDPAKFAALGLPFAPRRADLARADLTRADGALAEALADATHIVNTAHARHTEALLAAAPEAARLVLLGSTRRFTRFPDDNARALIAAESAFLASGRQGVLLHPTMIYGADGESNVRRLAALIARLPVLPLPRRGQNLVQPIYQDDVTEALLAALAIPWERPEVLVLAGPEPVTYAELIRAVARATGRRPPPILPVPATLLFAAQPLLRFLPGLPPVGRDEIRRLLEDKAFDITPARARLGFAPRPLDEGLAEMFGRARMPGR